MYMLRSSISNIGFCKIVLPSHINLNSWMVCPLCRISQISPTVVHTYRLQSTNAKASIVCLQLKKKKAKIKSGEYSELIRVEETSGNNIKESRTAIKKSSTCEILKNLEATDPKNLSKEIASIAARKNSKTDVVNRKNSLAPGVAASSSRSSKPASPASTVKRANAAETVQQLSKKTSSFLNDSFVKSQQSPQPKSAETSTSVRNLSDAFSDKLDDAAVINDFTMDQSCNMENIHIPRLEPFHPAFDEEYSTYVPNQELANDEEDKFHKRTSSKTKKLDKNDRSSKMRKSCDREKTSKVKKNDLEKARKDLHLNLSLRAFLDVCINSDMLSLAHSTLMNYQVKGRQLKEFPELTDIGLFNIVLTGYAQNGAWSKVKELYSDIQHERIKPNLQTYAGCLECISRLPTQDKRVIRDLLQDAENDHLDIAMLDHECTFVNEQRERVIKMVRLVHPDFQPTPRENLRHYSCNLLSRLNEEFPKDRFYDPLGGTMTYEQLLLNLRDQMEIEVTNKVVVRSIEKPAYGDDESLKKMRSVVRECEETWRVVLHRAFEQNIRTLSSQTAGKYSRSVTLQPFLMALSTNAYVDIMLEEVRLLAGSSETFSLPLFGLQFTIGLKVMNSYIRATKQKQGLVNKIETLYRKYCEYYVNPKFTSQFTPREYWEKLMNENIEGASITVDDKSWPSYLIYGIGKFLYDIIIQEVKIKRNLLKPVTTQGYQFPAFYRIYRKSGIAMKEEIKPHPILVQLYRSEMKDMFTFEGTVLPSLVPPLPWTSIRSGGYLLSSVKIIRIPDTISHHKLRLEETPNEQLSPIYDSLNYLGECPWRINKPILDIVIEIFNNKGDEALAIPLPPSEFPPLPSISLDMSKEERSKIFQERERLNKKKTEMHSLRCDGLYKLSIANHLRDKIFWFPHNCDFRGRVYPCPSHFNHLKGDMSRSLLLFAKGEPLGENGLDWLKIHLINLTGLKKQEAIPKRLKYANEMMPDIIDSSDNPLNGKRWWMKSDDPWQTLACCMEITNAIRSPDPKKYICHFPIHQDGSCNGLQHYAALGRDVRGAKQVNLYPTNKPQDVYNGVANLVENERAKDAKEGVKIAKVLEGFIKRKVIKQTVMTTVYGVTPFGARQQIFKQLRDHNDFPEDQARVASTYLTEKTFQSLRKMFTATRTIQDWLTEVAQLISHVYGQPVEWVTPLGLPIIQPYYRPTKTSISRALGKNYQTGMHKKMDIFLHPYVMRQKNAFPPNFIHSLDATHMMLTSLFCQREGITFVSVHDCYWTHPSKSIEIMNMICREQFVALHSKPILENLSKFLAQKCSYQDEIQNGKYVINAAKNRVNKVILGVPTTGNFNLMNVLKSTYFFS